MSYEELLHKVCFQNRVRASTFVQKLGVDYEGCCEIMSIEIAGIKPPLGVINLVGLF